MSDSTVHARRSLRRFASILLLFSAVATAQAADDGLLPLLAGEFALQGGDMQGAATAYVEAAEASADPQLAERAARIALAADTPALVRRAVRRWRTLAPTAAGALQVDAAVALREDDLAAAESALTALLAHPSGDGWKLAAQALGASSRSAQSGLLLRRLLDADALPDLPEAWIAFGAVSRSVNQTGLTLALAQRAAARHPDNVRLQLWLAEERQRSGDADGARAVLTALRGGPGIDPALRPLAAALYDRMGDRAAAAEVLGEGPQDDATRAARASYLARGRDLDAIRALYAETAALPEPRPDTRLFLLGQMAEVLEDSEQALAWYRAIGPGEHEDRAQIRIAVVLDALGRRDESRALLHALQDGEAGSGEVALDAFLLEAELLRVRSDHEGVLAVYGRALAAFTDEPALLYARALAYERVDRVAEAEADLRRLIDVDPENADALNALGYTLADRTDRYQEALGYIERALEMKPDSPAILDSMGWVLFRLQRLEDALDYLQRAFALQPDPEIAAHLGEVLWQLGRRDEAEAAWQQGLDAGPDLRVLKQTMQRLRP